MPIPDTDETSAMHPALVTALTTSKPHYRLGGLIPHLSREGCFWKSTRPAVHETIVEHQLSMDPVDSTYWRQVDRIICGWTPPLSKANDYNPNNGLHKTLSVDCLHGNHNIGSARTVLLLRLRHQPDHHHGVDQSEV